MCKIERDIEIKLKEDEVITPVNQHKVLGWILNTRLSMDSQIRNTISSVNLKLHKIMKMKKYMNLNTKRKILNAHLLSLYQYGIEQYVGETEAIKQKLHSSMMTTFRKIRGFVRYREANVSVLNHLKLVEPAQLILRATVKFIHKVVYTGMPYNIS